MSKSINGSEKTWAKQNTILMCGTLRKVSSFLVSSVWIQNESQLYSICTEMSHLKVILNNAYDCSPLLWLWSFIYIYNTYVIYFRFHNTYLLTLYFRTKEETVCALQAERLFRHPALDKKHDKSCLLGGHDVRGRVGGDDHGKMELTGEPCHQQAWQPPSFVSTVPTWNNRWISEAQKVVKARYM